MSEFLAKRITMRFIRKFQIKEEDWDLYYLGIEVIVTTALTSLMIMALGIALRNFFGSVVFLLCFMSIRGYCGGYHAKTRVRCFFVSILCYLLSFGMMKGLLFLPEIAQNILITIGVATAFIHFAKFAPVENPNKPLTKEQKKRNHRAASIAVIILEALSCGLYIFFPKVSALIAYTLFSIAVLILISKNRKGGNEYE